MSLYSAIPSQKKATKSCIITFLCQYYFFIKELQQTSSYSTRFDSLSSIFNFMEKFKREARQLISTELNSVKDTLLKSKRVSSIKVKRKYLADGAKKHLHIKQCDKCSHPYVNLPLQMIYFIASL